MIEAGQRAVVRLKRLQLCSHVPSSRRRGGAAHHPALAPPGGAAAWSQPHAQWSAPAPPPAGRPRCSAGVGFRRPIQLGGGVQASRSKGSGGGGGGSSGAAQLGDAGGPPSASTASTWSYIAVGQGAATAGGAHLDFEPANSRSARHAACCTAYRIDKRGASTDEQPGGRIAPCAMGSDVGLCWSAPLRP